MIFSQNHKEDLEQFVFNDGVHRR